MNKKQEKIDILNREVFINHVVKMVDKIADNNGNMTFAINGAWGCGKTFVLEKIQERLENDESNEFLVIPYNCWQYDYYEEPLIAIVAAVLDFADMKNIISEDTKIKLKEIIALLSKLVLPTATVIIGSKAGFSATEVRAGSIFLTKVVERIKNFFKKIKEDVEINHKYDGYYSFNKVLVELQNQLKKLSDKYKIVFCVDELDRCLPEYAIKVLERLHHVSEGVDNMVTIIAFDKERLKNTIGSIFGLENADNYLKKFIKFEMYLDYGKQDSSKFSEKFSDFYTRFDHDLWKLDEKKEKQFLEELFRDIDIRLQEEIVEEATIFHDLCFKNEEKKPDYTVMYTELFIVTESRTTIRFNIPSPDKTSQDDIFGIISAYCLRLDGVDDFDPDMMEGLSDDNVVKLREFKEILPNTRMKQTRIQKLSLPDATQLPQQPAVRKCSKCGALFLDDSLYCHSCGKERNKCGCGEFVDAGMNFCPKCGKILTVEQREEQQKQKKLQEEINKLAIECGFTNLPYNFIDRGKYIEIVPPFENEEKNIHFYMIEKGLEEMCCWNNAMEYANILEKGGFKDWRIPTIEELKIIYKFKDLCGITQYDDVFWSVSSSPDNTAWTMDFDCGNANFDNKCNEHYVRCVR